MPLDPRVIAAAVEAHDGFSPLNDSAHLVLDGSRAGEVIAEGDGFAILDDHDETILLAVSPGARGRGLGTQLARRALEDRPSHSFWAFRTTPAAEAIARKLALRPIRELLRMGHTLSSAPPFPAPSGYRIRPYQPSDAAQVVAVNATAFAHHPEQGRLSLDDFRALTRQAWFEGAGLLVATCDDEIVGFHWTKRHTPDVGEVYVLAVSPDHGGAGLGRALLSAGLAHLKAIGCKRVELYVEASEERVVDIYRAAGFKTLTVDTNYRR